MKQSRTVFYYLLAFSIMLAITKTPLTVCAATLEWRTENGKSYWYEDGIRQGTYDDKQGVIGDGTIRGREIYDPRTDAWYWLDAVFNGAKAEGKEVWMPYVYQDEDKWDNAAKRRIADESDSGMGDCVYNAIVNKTGKWVRYDQNGKMLKGWVIIQGTLAKLYPDQAGNIYYYDNRTGLMAKGSVVIDGQRYYFDETTGALLGDIPESLGTLVNITMDNWRDYFSFEEIIENRVDPFGDIEKYYTALKLVPKDGVIPQEDFAAKWSASGNYVTRYYDRETSEEFWPWGNETKPSPIQGEYIVSSTQTSYPLTYVKEKSSVLEDEWHPCWYEQIYTYSDIKMLAVKGTVKIYS